ASRGSRATAPGNGRARRRPHDPTPDRRVPSPGLRHGPCRASRTIATRADGADTNPLRRIFALTDARDGVEDERRDEQDSEEGAAPEHRVEESDPTTAHLAAHYCMAEAPAHQAGMPRGSGAAWRYARASMRPRLGP